MTSRRPSLELDRHHFQSDAIGVIAEVEPPRIGLRRSVSGRALLEAQAAMFNDVARAFTRDPVLGGGASPSEAHRAA
jgi:hypothetical protein